MLHHHQVNTHSHTLSPSLSLSHTHTPIHIHSCLTVHVRFHGDLADSPAHFERISQSQAPEQLAAIEGFTLWLRHKREESRVQVRMQ